MGGYPAEIGSRASVSHNLLHQSFSAADTGGRAV